VQATLLSAAGQVEGDAAALQILAALASSMQSETSQQVLEQAVATLLEQVAKPGLGPNFEQVGSRIVTDIAKGLSAGNARRVILDALVGPSRREFLPIDDLERSAEEAGLATAAGFSSSRVITEAERARSELTSRFAELPAEDIAALERTGVNAGLAYAEGLSDSRVLAAISEAAKELRAQTIARLNSEFEISSPSKVMIERGELIGLGLVEGFARAANRPVPALRGIQTGNLGGGSSQVTVNNVINHPTAGRLTTDVALLDQLTGAAGALLRSF